MDQVLRTSASGAADTQANVALVKSYFTAISGRPKTASMLDAYVSDEELKHHIVFFEQAFPLYALVAEDYVAEANKVAVRARFQGKHGGDLMGMAPTMKTVDVPFIIIYHIAGGKIAEHWMSIDQSELLKQLGVGA